MSDIDGGQLVQDHWRFIRRITNDEDEAQRLACHVLEKLAQFQPERSTFGHFVKLKLRELRQPDKRTGNYVSFDEGHDSEEFGDDEDIERNLYNLIPAPPPPIKLDLSKLSSQQRRIMELRLAGFTQREVAEREHLTPDRISQIEAAAEIGLCVDQVTEIYRDQLQSRRPAHCETLNDLGGFRVRVARIPGIAETAKPNWISPPCRQKHPRYYTALREERIEDRQRDRGSCRRPARKRISHEAFRHEEQARGRYRMLIGDRIYFGERVTGQRALPRDTLWKKELPDFLAAHWRESIAMIRPRRAMSWRRWIGLMELKPLAWMCEWRRAWVTYNGAGIYFRADHSDQVTLEFFEREDGDESWSVAADARTKTLPKRRSACGPWRGHRDLTRWYERSNYDLAHVRAHAARNGGGHLHPAALVQNGRRSWPG